MNSADQRSLVCGYIYMRMTLSGAQLDIHKTKTEVRKHKNKDIKTKNKDEEVKTDR